MWWEVTKSTDAFDSGSVPEEQYSGSVKKSWSFLTTNDRNFEMNARNVEILTSSYK